MKKMINNIQNYAWGSTTALSELYGISNPENKPMAEMWMGAHPSCSSEIIVDNQKIPLNAFIDKNKETCLGQSIATRFGELPFLFKVLCAGQPLSIQVHPNKAAAEKGFAKEQAEGIPINAAQRHYKDPNHKPELVFALTPFLAMNGFRPLDEIATLFTQVRSAHPVIELFITQPNQQNLAKLFSTLLTLKDAEKQQAISVLKTALPHYLGQQPWDSINYIAQFYPEDNGLFSPLLLNIVMLQPGEAMFLYAETPHAYLQGSALEVMANSDNVLRAGLTPKYIDVAELLANLKFDSQSIDSLLMQPVKNNDATIYPIPVDDFAFSLHQLSDNPQSLIQDSAAIVFCVSGKALLHKAHETIMLNPGESCFIAANESPITVTGQGTLARVFNH